MDPFLRQQPDQPGGKLRLLGLDLAHLEVTLLDLLGGQAAIDAVIHDTGADLLFQAADTFHEKFVQIGADDTDELEPFQQRVGFVPGFVQNPLVELQPGQLAVEIKLRGRQVDFALRGR